MKLWLSHKWTPMLGSVILLAALVVTGCSGTAAQTSQPAPTSGGAISTAAPAVSTEMATSAGSNATAIASMAPGSGTAVASLEATGAASASGTGTPAATGMSGNTVTVTLTDTALQLPTQIPAGKTTFSVTNNGKAAHGFAIDENGVVHSIPADLAAGDTGSILLVLKPGTYQVYSPTDDDKSKGLSSQITVGP